MAFDTLFYVLIKKSLTIRLWGNKMKRSLLALFALLLMLCTPIVAFAEDYPNGIIPSSWVEDGKTFLGTFDIKDLPKEEIAFFQNFLANESGAFVQISFSTTASSPSSSLAGRLIIVSLFSVPSDATARVLTPTYGGFSFRLTPPSSSLSFTMPVEHVYLPSSQRVFTRSSFSSSHAIFELYSGNYSSADKYYNQRLSVNVGAVSLDGGILGLTIPSHLSHKMPNDILMFKSNLVNEPEPPPPSSSEPPAPPIDPPAPPVPEQPPVNYPTFPKVEGKYIFYDTSIWNKFANDVRGSIGSTVNIGIGILKIIVGIWVTIWIVRQFTGVKSHHKGE